jgi:hypothetical protein
VVTAEGKIREGADRVVARFQCLPPPEAQPAGQGSAYKIAPGEQAWRDNAQRLVEYVRGHLVNRSDCYGRYKPDGSQFTCKDPLTRTIIDRHFRPYVLGNIIGLHTTCAVEILGPDGQPFLSCTSLWGNNDIDFHGAGVPPERNFLVARHWHRRLLEYGFHPLLVDSNGNGGFRNFLLFRAPVPTATLFHLIRWVMRDWQEQGLAAMPEAFPKQPAIKAAARGGR